jgi:hypothetical protein
MMKPKSDDPESVRLYKAWRKEVSARYYQRNRKTIKLATTLNVSMKTARAIATMKVAA